MKYIFKNYNEYEIDRLKKRAKIILNLESSYRGLTDLELRNKTFEFREKLNNNAELDEILNDVFAVCREATFRILKKKQYEVQIIGGIALHQGRIVEMKTGEGKTLTELCPAYLNALNRKGVHIVTSNEYLAERDKIEMESLFQFLNISVGLVIEKTKDKKEEYKKDIIYSTNVQLGFDYLRDNLVYNLDDKVQRELNFVIIDEVDSVLIDEARTPLIISEKVGEEVGIYKKINEIVKNFEEKDFYIDKRDESVFLSDIGMGKIENALKVRDLTLRENIYINHVAMQALRANFLLSKDIDYIVEDDEIFLIDQNTGRIAEGRVFSDGLQQCIEAKEKIEIKSSTKTLAIITYQYLFKLYKKMAGMSGTVKTEETEFREIYNLDVISIPTNKKIKRIDREDKIFCDESSKFISIINDVIETNKKGQPILIGTQSIKDSEEMARLLEMNKVKFKVLNAKTKKEEDEVIKGAGKVNSIIVATNIAGRGTDIKLTHKALKLGGLKIIGNGRSDALRIDNQLIGRSGRQGEIGESCFYISCDDEILSIYGDNKLKKYLAKNNKKIDKNGRIPYKVAGKFIRNAQKYINGMNFEARKQTVEFDEVINIQRNIIYKERNEILKTTNLAKILSRIILEYIEINIRKFSNSINYIEKSNDNLKKLELAEISAEDKNKLKLKIRAVFTQNLGLEFKSNIEEDFFKESIMYESIAAISNFLIENFNRIFEIKNINENDIRKLFISIIDIQWQEYLANMEYLKEYVRDQVYNQKRPIDIYRLEGKSASEELNKAIKINLVESLFSYIICKEL